MPRNFTLLLKLFGLVVDGLERCRTCQIGEYQSEYAQVTCSACPGGKSTISRGATSLSQCKGKTNYESKTKECANFKFEVKSSVK